MLLLIVITMIFKYIEIVKKCVYIQKKNNNSNNSFCSLSYLVKDKNLTHSQKIKLGFGLEHFFDDLIRKTTTYKCINKKKFLNPNQIDGLYINKKCKKIIYTEYKSNIILDSQKRKATMTHCNYIYNKIKTEYKEYKIQGYIVNLRFLNIKDMPNVTSVIKCKNKDNIKVIGINEFLKLFKCPLFKNYTEYTKFLSHICEQNFIKK